uniref:Protein LLP homolog n=1 Tax=Acartia pacifica TaxID=335913 RepID=A0A0U2UN83_ACAPC|nr:putative protein LLP homolog isoform X1 [Acartia pacifica]
MAKSLRSKWKRKMRAERRVKFAARDKQKLEMMVEKAKQKTDVEMKTATEIKEDTMDTAAKSEFNSKTLRNEHGTYPKWVSKRKIRKIKKATKPKKNKKK